MVEELKKRVAFDFRVEHRELETAAKYVEKIKQDWIDVGKENRGITKFFEKRRKEAKLLSKFEGGQLELLKRRQKLLKRIAELEKKEMEGTIQFGDEMAALFRSKEAAGAIGAQFTLLGRGQSALAGSSTGVGTAVKETLVQNVERLNSVMMKTKSRIIPILSSLKGAFISFGLAGSAALGWIIFKSPALQAQLRIMDTQFSRVGRALGDVFVPHMQEANEIIGDMVDLFLGLPQPVIDTIAYLIGLSAVVLAVSASISALSLIINPITIAIAAIALAVGAAFLIFQNWNDIVNALTEAWENGSDGMRAFMVVAGVMLAPIGLIIGGLVLLIATIDTMITHWDDIVSALETATNAMQSWTDTWDEWITGVADTITSTLGEGFWGEMLGGIVQTIGDAITTIMQMATDLVDMFFKLASGDWGGAAEAFGNIFIDLLNYFIDVLNNLMVDPVNALIEQLNKVPGIDIGWRLADIPSLGKSDSGGGGGGTQPPEGVHEFGGMLRTTGSFYGHAGEVILNRQQVRAVGGSTRAQMLGKSGGGGMNGTTIAPTIYLTVQNKGMLDEEQLAQKIERKITDNMRRMTSFGRR